jgi:hypothetical protein
MLLQLSIVSFLKSVSFLVIIVAFNLLQYVSTSRCIKHWTSYIDRGNPHLLQYSVNNLCFHEFKAVERLQVSDHITVKQVNLLHKVIRFSRIEEIIKNVFALVCNLFFLSGNFVVEETAHFWDAAKKFK